MATLPPTDPLTACTSASAENSLDWRAPPSSAKFSILNPRDIGTVRSGLRDWQLEATDVEAAVVTVIVTM